MNSFTVKIADLTVGISYTHALVKRMCEEYLSEEAPIFFVRASEKEKEELRKDFLGFSQSWSEESIEFTAIRQHVCEGVINYNAAVFHAALISFDGEGVAFTAPSGTGKTTHIKLWSRVYGDRVECINGDKPLFTLRDGKFFASGMPWSGKEHWNCNKTVPLKAICFVDRAETNSISSLDDNREIMRRLFFQLMMPKDDALMVKYLDFANKLVNTVPFYLLRCNMDPDAARVAHDGIFGVDK